MLQFTAPLWLTLLPPVALFGAWAIRRSQRTPRPIPSLRFWRDTADSDAPRRRAIDPLWLLFLIAALAAVTALAGPAWSTSQPATPPPLQVQWSIRTLAPPPATTAAPPLCQAWLRLLDTRPLPATLSFTAASPTEKIDRTFPVDELRAGIILPLPPAPSYTFTLRANNRASNQTFLPAPANKPFGLLTITGAAPPDPALLRALQLIPGAQPADPTAKPAVVLVNDPRATWQSLAELAGDGPRGGGVIIAEPNVPLPGIQLAELPATLVPPFPDPDFAQPVRTPNAPLPDFIHFDSITATFRKATVSPDWIILATANGYPWLALRPPIENNGVRSPACLWMASRPSLDSDFATSPSFILLLATLIDRGLATGDLPSRVTDWQPQYADTAPVPANNAPLRSLAPACSIAALLLTVMAVTLLLHRARAFGASSVRV